VDTFSPEKRSDIMRRVRSTNTTPEKKVRSLLHKLGFRFRLHRRDLPGKPDIILPKYRAVVFVHGCFWHRHQDCPHATTPSSNKEYWLPKFKRTIERDKKNREELRQKGWNAIIVWECETNDLQKLRKQVVMKIYREQTHSMLSPVLCIAAEQTAEYNSENE